MSRIFPCFFYFYDLLRSCSRDSAAASASGSANSWDLYSPELREEPRAFRPKRKEAAVVTVGGWDHRCMSGWLWNDPINSGNHFGIHRKPASCRPSFLCCRILSVIGRSVVWQIKNHLNICSEVKQLVSCTRLFVLTHLEFSLLSLHAKSLQTGSFARHTQLQPTSAAFKPYMSQIHPLLRSPVAVLISQGLHLLICFT